MQVVEMEGCKQPETISDTTLHLSPSVAHTTHSLLNIGLGWRGTEGKARHSTTHSHTYLSLRIEAACASYERVSHML
jgi:hypothetical protein